MELQKIRESILWLVIGVALPVVLLVFLALRISYFTPSPAMDSVSIAPIMTLTAVSPISTPTPTGTVTVNETWSATKTAVVAMEAARPTPIVTWQPTLVAPTPIITPRPTAFEPIPWSTPAGSGAIIEVAPPFSTYQYHIENEWYEDLSKGSMRLIVYAGSISGTGGGYTDQGVIIVQILEISSTNSMTPFNLVESTQYLTPGQAGPVRVVAADGERLQLESTTGSTFYFDVSSRQFVEDSTQISPLPTAETMTVEP